REEIHDAIGMARRMAGLEASRGSQPPVDPVGSSSSFVDQIECARRPICFRCDSSRGVLVMTSHRRFGITLLLSLASILPATVGAQPPVYLTQWGSPGSGNGEFNRPYRVAVDAAGDVYVVDWERESLGSNSRIQKFTGTGTYLTQWGSFGSGDGQFYRPEGVATDVAGYVYVVHRCHRRVQEFTDTGTYLTQWGSNGSGDGQFFNPSGVAVDAAGHVYVADTNNH